MAGRNIATLTPPIERWHRPALTHVAILLDATGRMTEPQTTIEGIVAQMLTLDQQRYELRFRLADGSWITGTRDMWQPIYAEYHRQTYRRTV